MKHLFLFPTEPEAAPFRRLCPNAEIVISGVGMAETAAAMMRIAAEYDVTECDVVLCGIAGVYDGRGTVGEVVEVVAERVAGLPERFQREYHVVPVTTLRGVTSNTVCGCGAPDGDADIENMEGAALFAMVGTMGMRGAEIRAISNRVGEEFADWDIPLATDNLAKVLKREFVD